MNIPEPVVERVSIHRLAPWPKNPRKNHAVAEIGRSIEAFGYLSPIVVQARTYRILAGHGRLEALKRAGVTEVPVIVADIDDDRADLYTLADNKLTERAEWDFAGMADLLLDFDARNLDTTLTGFDDDELKRIMGYTAFEPPTEGAEVVPAPFEVIVRCRSEREQVDVARRLMAEGLEVETRGGGA